MIFLFALIFNTQVFANDIELAFGPNHPSRLNVITQLFSKIQQSAWQWQRDGIFERRDNCLHWRHDHGAGEIVNTSTCLRVNGSEHILSIVSSDLRDNFKFVAREGVHWTIEDLLSFDAVLLARDLVHFSSAKSGLSFNYSPGKIHFRTVRLAGYEFFVSTIPWQDGGYRQEVFGRCPTCSARRYRAFLYADDRIEYRASHSPGAITPQAWSTFLSFSYTYMLNSMASDLDIFHH